MTTINRIAAKNVKGRTFNHTLAPVTVFSGPNAAGKTAIADAIRVGLTGQHGKLGKRDVTLLAGGASMSIAVEFSNGKSSTHDWTHKAGSWKYKGDVAVGVPIPAVMLDASAYFTLTNDERIKFIFRLIPADKVGLSVAEVVAALNRLPAPSARVVEARVALEKEVTSAFVGVPLADALDKSVALCKKAKADADAVAKQMTSSILAQAQMQATEGMTIARNVDGQLEAARQSVASLTTKLAELRKEAAAAAAAQHRLDQLEDEVRAAQVAADLIGNLEGDVAGMRAALEAMPDGAWEAANAEVEAVQRDERSKQAAWREATERTERAAKQAERRTMLTAELAALTPQIEDAKAKVTVAAQRMAEAAKATVEARGQVNLAAANIRFATADAEDSDRKLAESASHQTCPWCEASDPGWKDKVVGKLTALLDSRKSTLASALTIGKEANTRLTHASLAEDSATDAHKVSFATLRALEDRAAKVEGELSGMASTGREKSQEELDVMAAEIAALAVGFEALTLAAATATQVQVKATTERTKRLATRDLLNKAEARLLAAKGAREKLAVLQAESATLAKVPQPEMEDVTLVADGLVVAEALVKTLTDATKRAAAEAQDAKRRDQARAEAEEVKGVADFAKAAAEALVTMQSETIAHAFGAVLADAQRITEGILGTPLCYRDGEIGRVEDGVFISHRTFSGMEERLAYSALQVALAGPDAALKLVMIDELGTLDAVNKAALINRMLDLTAEGLVGQFIGFDVDAEFYCDPKQEWEDRGLQVTEVAGK